MVTPDIHKSPDDVLKNILAQQGGYLTKVRTIVRHNQRNKKNPITLDVGGLVGNVFVAECARALRELPKTKKLRDDFRASLSRSGQIIFDVNITNEDDFIALFSAFDRLSVPKN